MAEFPRRLRKFLGTLVVRIYTLAILAVIVWAGYAAVAYMIRTVFFPVQVPPRFVPVATRPTIEDLEEGRLRAISMQEGRAALGRYHEVTRWFQPDPHNGCLISGCHSPVPHERQKETRAFANFHAVFLNCQMCHDARHMDTVPATWVSTDTGEPQGVPALLQLLKLFETDREKIANDPASVHPQVVRLLRDILTTVGGDPALEYLLLQMNTSEAGSPVWRQAVGELGVELPNHARGEYAAKISPQVPLGTLEQDRIELASLAEQYFTPGANRTSLQKQIHENVLAKPEACLTCHGGEPPRLNLEALGYPPQRVAELRSNAIAGMIQRLREGGTFHLPQLLEGGNAP